MGGTLTFSAGLALWASTASTATRPCQAPEARCYRPDPEARWPIVGTLHRQRGSRGGELKLFEDLAHARPERGLVRLDTRPWRHTQTGSAVLLVGFGGEAYLQDA